MTPGASGVYSCLSHWAVRAIRVSGWVAAAFTCIGFGGSIVMATDLFSHFRVAYAVALLAALATFLPEIKRRKWSSAPPRFRLLARHCGHRRTLRAPASPPRRRLRRALDSAASVQYLAAESSRSRHALIHRVGAARRGVDPGGYWVVSHSDEPWFYGSLPCLLDRWRRAGGPPKRPIDPNVRLHES